MKFGIPLILEPSVYEYNTIWLYMLHCLSTLVGMGGSIDCLDDLTMPKAGCWLELLLIDTTSMATFFDITTFAYVTFDDMILIFDE